MPADESDTELLLTLGRTGDATAFTELARRWDYRLLLFLTKASGDPEAAQDLRQDVFLRIYRHARTYSPEFAASTWIMKIALNTLRTWRTRTGSNGERNNAIDASTLPLEDSSSTPFEFAVQRERQDIVRVVMDRLPMRDRELVLLRFQMELNYRQIAELLETPESTIKSRMTAILRRLHDVLQPLQLLERTNV